MECVPAKDEMTGSAGGEEHERQCPKVQNRPLGVLKHAVLLSPPVSDGSTPATNHSAAVISQSLGGTIQHLLHNGIIHNFRPDDPKALACLEAIWQVEDALTDAGLLAGDFMLLIGKRRS